MLANQLFHFECVLEDLAVLGFAESYGCERRRPVPDGVRVHRKAIDVPTPFAILIGLHDGFRPIGPLAFAAARADRNLAHLLLVLLCRVEVPDEAAVDLELAEIVVERHIAAAAPTFVADTEIADPIGLSMTVSGAFLGQRRRLSRGQILQPFGGFPWSTGADID